MTPEQTAEAIIEQVFIENEVDFYFDGGAAINLIAAAIRNEREACAKIAEEHFRDCHDDYNYENAGYDISVKIRARKP